MALKPISFPVIHASFKHNTFLVTSLTIQDHILDTRVKCRWFLNLKPTEVIVAYCDSSLGSSIAFKRAGAATTLPSVKWVGAGSPVGQEQAQANSLENASEGANGNGVERSLLGDDLGDELNVTGQ